MKRKNNSLGPENTELYWFREKEVNEEKSGYIHKVSGNWRWSWIHDISCVCTCFITMSVIVEHKWLENRKSHSHWQITKNIVFTVFRRCAGPNTSDRIFPGVSFWYLPNVQGHELRRHTLLVHRRRPILAMLSREICLWCWKASTELLSVQ